MASVLDFNRMCRACLSNTGPMKDLFTVCTPKVFTFCTSVEINEGDNMPNQLCLQCIDLLNKSYLFKQAAVKSNSVLKQLLSQKPPLIIKKTQSQCSEIIEINQEDIIQLHEQELDLLEPQLKSPDLQRQSLNERQTSVVRIVESNVKEATEKQLQNFNQRTTSSDNDASDQNIEPADIIRKIRKKRELTKPLRKRTRMQCPKCNKSFQKYENFEAHLRSHFGKKPDIKCEYCDKTFRSLRNLHIHVRTHTGVRKYQCLTCGKSFAYLNVLKNHELIHSGVKNHICHICDAKFVQRYNLKIHLETHTNEKNYVCGQCGKKFAQPGNLKVHLIRHTGIKNIACQLCDMRFYIKSDLFKHMRSHSSDRPFACEFCDKTFKCKSFKDVHLRTHTGERPYACDICSKSFMARKDMRNHRMIHTGEKPHKCQLCDQAFIQKCALNRHMKGHIRKEIEEAQKPTTNILIAARLPGVEYPRW